MEKLFAGAAAAVILSAALPAWAAAPDAPQPPQAIEPAAQTVTARAHLIFKAAAEPPVVGDLTVIEQGGALAMIKTSFTTAARALATPAVAPCPPAKDKAPATKTVG
jgi:hypothetical protein